MRAFYALCTVLFLVGCATPGYKSQEGHGLRRDGYSESRLTAVSFRVKYIHWDSKQAYSLFLRRAAELTIAGGFEYFTVSDVGAHDDNFGPGLAMPQYEGTVLMSKVQLTNSVKASEVVGLKVGGL